MKELRLSEKSQVNGGRNGCVIGGYIVPVHELETLAEIAKKLNNKHL